MQALYRFLHFENTTAYTWHDTVVQILKVWVAALSCCTAQRVAMFLILKLLQSIKGLLSSILEHLPFNKISFNLIFITPIYCLHNSIF